MANSQAFRNAVKLRMTGVGKSNGYTVDPDDDGKTFYVDASAGNVTITLPALASVTDAFQVTVVKIDESDNQVIIDGDGSEPIDGDVSKYLTAPFTAMTVKAAQSGSTYWRVVHSGHGARNIDNHANIRGVILVSQYVTDYATEKVVIRGQLRPRATAAMAAGTQPVSAIDADVLVHADNNQNWTQRLVSVNGYSGSLAGSSGVISDARTFQSSGAIDGATFTNFYGYYAEDPGGAAALTNYYAFYAASISKASALKYSFFAYDAKSFFGGGLDVAQSGADTDSDITFRRVKALDNVTAYATILTLSPSVVTGYMRGIIEATVAGHTSSVGNGALARELWYFDIAAGAPTVAQIAAGSSSGAGAPLFRLNVSGNNIQIQVQSSDGVNGFYGMADVRVVAPKGAGAHCDWTLA